MLITEDAIKEFLLDLNEYQSPHDRYMSAEGRKEVADNIKKAKKMPSGDSYQEGTGEAFLYDLGTTDLKQGMALRTKSEQDMENGEKSSWEAENDFIRGENLLGKHAHYRNAEYYLTTRRNNKKYGRTPGIYRHNGQYYKVGEDKPLTSRY